MADDPAWAREEIEILLAEGFGWEDIYVLTGLEPKRVQEIVRDIQEDKSDGQSVPED